MSRIRRVLILLTGLVLIVNTASVFAQTPGDDMLGPNEELGIDQSITSADGRFTLIMQSDGNLVLYWNGGRALWASNTVGSGGTRAIMQSDGNFVIYTRDGAPVWATNTVSTVSTLVVQNDGNLVIYVNGAVLDPSGATWSSNSVLIRMEDYLWEQGQNTVEMMDVNAGFCFLSAVRGKFRGSGEEVWIRQNNNRWILGGDSGQKDVLAAARCVTYASFSGVTFDRFYLGIVEGDKNRPGQREMGAQSICFLTGLSGKFQGGREAAMVSRDSNGTFYGAAYSGQGYIRGEFGCFDWLGANGNLIRNARMSFDSVTPNLVQGRGEDCSPSSNNDTCYSFYQYASADDALCVLTGIQGKFEGEGELVSLFVDRLLIMSGQRDVGAGVACYYYNQ